MENKRLPFQAALTRYRQAKDRAANTRPSRFAAALEKVDAALDELLAVPSPSLGAFSEKMHILKREYGRDAQPRHIGAIYADVAVLATIYADTIFRSWPGT